MSIRVKLMLLLLVMASGGLVTLALIDYRATTKLGAEIARTTRESLASRAEHELRGFVRDSGRLLAREQAMFEAVLQAQAGEVRDLMTGTNGGSGRALVALAERMTRLRAITGEITHRHHVALASGPEVSYPPPGEGVAAPPEGYDPRTTDWYRSAVEAGEPIWTRPTVDPLSGVLVLCHAAPIYGVNGELLAVTSLEVRVADVMESMRATADWGGNADMMLVTVLDENDEGVLAPLDRPVVLTRRHGGEIDDTGVTSTTWETFRERASLDTDNLNDAQALAAAMASGRGGTRRMLHHGEPSICAYAPLRAERGLHIAVIVPLDDMLAGANAAEQTVLAATRTRLQLTGAALGVGLVVIVLVSLGASRSITRPVEALRDAAERLASGDLDARAHIETGDEIEKLAHAFNAMVPKLRDRLELRGSLKLAMQVQQRLLPPGPPEVPGFDIAGRSHYCDETGGDYYDFIDLGEVTNQPDRRRMAIVVGDVSGHGIAAALLMTTARAVLRTRADLRGTLAELVTAMNLRLCADANAGQFMTMFFLVFEHDLAGAWTRAEFVSAGHDPALVYDPKTDRFTELAGEDIPLGIDADWVFTQHTTEGPVGGLHEGRVLVIGTDGIWEARNPAGEMFGKNRLREIVRRCADRPSSEIATAVTNALNDWRSGLAQADDVTLVVLKADPTGAARAARLAAKTNGTRSVRGSS